MWGNNVLVMSLIVSTYLMFAVSGMILLISRRNSEPIKSRKPWMVICESVGWTVWTVLRSISRGLKPVGIPCIVDIFLPQTFLIIGSSILCIRTMYLLIQFNVTVDSINWYIGKDPYTKNSKDIQTDSKKEDSDYAASLRTVSAPMFQTRILYSHFKDPEANQPLRTDDFLGNMNLADSNRTASPNKRVTTPVPVMDIKKEKNLFKAHTAPTECIGRSMKKVDMSWYLRHRAWFSNANLAKFIVLFCAIQLTALILPVLLSYNTRGVYAGDLQCMAPQYLGSWIGQSWMISDSFICIIVSVMLKNVDERLGIKKELRSVSGCFFIITILVSIDLATTHNAENFFRETTSINIYYPIILLISTSYIMSLTLYSSWIKSFHFGSSNSDKSKFGSTSQGLLEEELLGLLNDPFGFELFQNHLRMELCVENILFWRDLELFRIKEIDALTIYETYLVPTAPLQVGISSDTRIEIEKHFGDLKLERVSTQRNLGTKELELDVMDKMKQTWKHINEVPENVFDRAYKEQFRNMYDPYLRFKSSPAYTEYLKSREERDDDSMSE